MVVDQNSKLGGELQLFRAAVPPGIGRDLIPESDGVLTALGVLTDEGVDFARAEHAAQQSSQPGSCCRNEIRQIVLGLLAGDFLGNQPLFDRRAKRLQALARFGGIQRVERRGQPLAQEPIEHGCWDPGIPLPLMRQHQGGNLFGRVTALGRQQTDVVAFPFFLQIICEVALSQQRLEIVEDLLEFAGRRIRSPLSTKSTTSSGPAPVRMLAPLGVVSTGPLASWTSMRRSNRPALSEGGS